MALCSISGTLTLPTGAVSPYAKLRLVKASLSGTVIMKDPTDYTASVLGVVSFNAIQGSTIYVYCNANGLDTNGPQGVALAVPASATANLEDLIAVTTDQVGTITASRAAVSNSSGYIVASTTTAAQILALASLTASRALVSDSSGNIVHATTTSTQLNSLATLTAGSVPYLLATGVFAPTSGPGALIDSMGQPTYPNFTVKQTTASTLEDMIIVKNAAGAAVWAMDILANSNISFLDYVNNKNVLTFAAGATYTYAQLLSTAGINWAGTGTVGATSMGLSRVSTTALAVTGGAPIAAGGAYRDLGLRQLLVNGTTSGVITVTGAAIAGTWTLTLPADGGTSGYVLQTNGSGTTTWAAASTGLTIGSTAVASGTGGGVLYETAGHLAGEISTLTSDGTSLTFAPTVTTGTGATAGLNANANSLTTGDAFNFGSSSVSSGSVFKISATGTAAASNTKTALNVATSGANGASTQTTYGAQFSNISTGTSSTNVGALFTASGATNNYAAIFIGNVGFGSTSPSSQIVVKKSSSSALVSVLALQTNGGLPLVQLGTESNLERRGQVTIYGTDDGAGNYERVRITHTGDNNDVIVFESEKGGTGTARGFRFTSSVSFRVGTLNAVGAVFDGGQAVKSYVGFNETNVGNKGGIGFAAGDYDLVFHNGNNGHILAGTERFRVTQAGLFGINTGASPGAQLQITTSGVAVVGQIIKGAASQVGDYLNVNSSGGSSGDVFKLTSAGLHTLTGLDAVTNSLTAVQTIQHNSSGTPAASFGSRVLFNLHSTTTTNQNAGSLDVYWSTATHASRTSVVALCAVNNAAALAEVLTIRGDGLITPLDGSIMACGTTTGLKIGSSTANKIAFFNSTPIVQFATTGETTGFTANAGTATRHDSTYTGNVGSTAYTISDVVKAMKNFGLMAA